MNDIFLLTHARRLAEEKASEKNGKSIYMLVKQFLAMNTKLPNQIKSLSVKYFVKKKAAPHRVSMLECICMNVGKKEAVATDGALMLINPNEYEEVEDATSGVVAVDVKTREPVEGVYPDYRRVVKQSQKHAEPVYFREIEDIVFDAKIGLIEAQLKDTHPYVRIDDPEKNNGVKIYISTSYVQILQLVGIEGWFADCSCGKLLTNPLIKTCEGGEMLLIKPVGIK